MSNDKQQKTSNCQTKAGYYWKLARDTLSNEENILNIFKQALSGIHKDWQIKDNKVWIAKRIEYSGYDPHTAYDYTVFMVCNNCCVGRWYNYSVDEYCLKHIDETLVKNDICIDCYHQKNNK